MTPQTSAAAPAKRRRMRVRFAWYDMWLGAFYDRQKRVLYVCPLPMLLIEWRRGARPDTFPQWLRWRFGEHAPEWERLDEADQTFWEHEAAAVRRAVARGGFKREGA